jgi:GTPase Era involved in 16S rRNA processing
MMSNLDEAYDLREKYTCFHILVIGRANAGKTTLQLNMSMDACALNVG